MDNIEIPITVVQQTVNVPITPDSPVYVRESANEPSAKVSEFVRALEDDLAVTDLIAVSRPNVSTKATTLAVLAQFLSQAGIGAALLQEDADALPKKISQLAAAADLTGDEALAVTQAGETVRARMIDIANFLKTVVGTGNVFSPVGLHYGAGVTAQQQQQNTAIIQALHDSISPDFGGQGGVLYIPGIVKFGGLQRHPAVGMMGDGRGTTKWICADNCPFVFGTRRVAGVITPNAPGEQRAMIYGLARAPYSAGQIKPTEATEAWFSVIRDVTLVGNKQNQGTNWVAAIYDEAGSSDPNYQDVSGQGQEAKAYSGMYCENVEVHSFSGAGFYSGGDRQRAYWHVCRSLNHGIVTDSVVTTTARGWDIKGNDSLIGPRCGGGGCTDIAVVFSGPSGAGITQGNFWGGNDYSANAATCVKARGCNGIFFVGNTWNGNVTLDYGDGSSVNRGVVVVGNRTQYDRTLFPVNTGEPIGLEQPNRNAAYTVIGYKQYCVRGNTVTAASQTNRTMLYLLWASEGATGGAQFDYNSSMGAKPFAAASPVMTDTGGSCTYEITDVATSKRYINGQIVNEGTSAFSAMYGASGTAEESYTMVSGSNITLVGAPDVYLDAAAEIAVLPLTMPPPRGNGHTVRVYFAQKVRSLQFLVTGQDAPTDGGTPQNIVKSTKGVPAFVLPGTTIQFRYNRALTQWAVNGLWNVEDPPSLKDPVRQYGAVMDGVQLNTTMVQQAFTDAKQAAASGFTYGLGGRVRFQVGVSKQGAILASRWVGIEGPGGALGAAVLRMDYADRAGVPGEDAAIKVDDDGSQQASLVGQQRIAGIAIDGRNGQQPVGHLRHGIWYPAPAEGNTDRAPALFDVHMANMPGAGWKITGNDQIRGVNVKILDSEYGFDFDDVSDGKLDQIGLGGNRKGNRANNCSSLKLSKIDSWISSSFNGDWLWQFLSCSKLAVSDGEFEGPVLMTGDNHRVYSTPGLSNSKFAFQNGQNVLSNINFKVSTDYYVAKGNTRPLAHLVIKDLHGTQIPGCTFGYKLGFTPSAEELAATPDYLFYFDTQLPSANANYAAALRNCGQLDVSRTSMVWHFSQLNSSGVPQTAVIVAAREHVTNRPDRLVGLRIGVPKLKRTGTLAQNEIALAGQNLTSDKYPLLYLFTEPGGTWARRLTDGGGAAAFTLENLSSAAPAGFVYCCEFE